MQQTSSSSSSGAANHIRYIALAVASLQQRRKPKKVSHLSTQSPACSLLLIQTFENIFNLSSQGWHMFGWWLEWPELARRILRNVRRHDIKKIYLRRRFIIHLNIFLILNAFAIIFCNTQQLAANIDLWVKSFPFPSDLSTFWKINFY